MPQIPQLVMAPADRPLIKLVTDAYPQPAAGQNLVYTVPDDYQFQLITLHLGFTTDANIIDRNLFVQLDTPSGVAYYFRHPFIIINGETRTLTLATGVPLIAHTVAVMDAVWPWPPQLTAEQGFVLTIGLTAIQAGDQFTAAPGIALAQIIKE